MSNRLEKQYKKRVEGGVVAATLTISSVSEIPVNSYAACRYFSESTFTTPATPGAGTVLIEVKLATNDQWVTVSGGTLDATDASAQASWQGNITAVRATPTGLTTATHYQVYAAMNAV
jgi:hypothetical protein